MNLNVQIDNQKIVMLSNEAQPISEVHALEIQQRPEYARYVREVDSVAEFQQPSLE